MDMSMASTSTMGDMAMGTAASQMSMMPTATPAMGSGMDMGMGMGGSSCKISMLWNWYTVDSCFISSTWHITSKGMFAGSCIGVVVLVCALEFLRRLSREYDRYILTNTTRGVLAPFGKRRVATNATQATDSDLSTTKHGHRVTERGREGSLSSGDDNNHQGGIMAPRVIRRRGPTMMQQMIRAVLHMLHFGVAYFIMLLAMYYNGYIIISILLGALIGSFIFSWDMSAEYEGSGCCG